MKAHQHQVKIEGYPNKIFTWLEGKDPTFTDWTYVSTSDWKSQARILIFDSELDTLFKIVWATEILLETKEESEERRKKTQEILTRFLEVAKGA